MKRILGWCFVLLITLGACIPSRTGTLETQPVLPTPVISEPDSATAIPATETDPTPVVSNGSDLAETLPDGAALQQRMKAAHLRWQTVWGDLEGTSYPGDGSDTILSHNRAQIWIQQPTQALVLTGTPEGELVELWWVSDGVYSRDPNGEVMPYPEYVTNPLPLPADAPADTILEPPGLLLGIPYSDLVFPIAMASLPGDYVTTGKEVYLGRDVYVLAWNPPGGAVLNQYWVDAATGVVLRWQNYSKPDGAALTADTYFTAIRFDVIMPEGIFNLDIQVPEGFANSYTGFLTTP